MVDLPGLIAVVYTMSIQTPADGNEMHHDVLDINIAIGQAAIR